MTDGTSQPATGQELAEQLMDIDAGTTPRLVALAVECLRRGDLVPLVDEIDDLSKDTLNVVVFLLVLRRARDHLTDEEVASEME